MDKASTNVERERKINEREWWIPTTKKLVQGGESMRQDITAPVHEY